MMTKQAEHLNHSGIVAPLFFKFRVLVLADNYWTWNTLICIFQRRSLGDYAIVSKKLVLGNQCLIPQWLTSTKTC